MEYLKAFYDNVIKKINAVNSDLQLTEARKILVKAFINKKRIYTFGTGHSHMLGEELYVRAGGWNYIQPMLVDEITLSSHPWKSTWIERESGYANVLLEMFPVSAGDVVIITSNSGRNSLIVEMALKCQARKAKVIAVTSLKHSNQITSRHPSKKLLKDCAEVVIDNHSEIGDTVFTIQNQKCGSTSTIIHTYIAQRITLDVFSNLDNQGKTFSTFKSSNLDNQDQRNESLLKNK